MAILNIIPTCIKIFLLESSNAMLGALKTPKLLKLNHTIYFPENCSVKLNMM